MEKVYRDLLIKLSENIREAKKLKVNSEFLYSKDVIMELYENNYINTMEYDYYLQEFKNSYLFRYTKPSYQVNIL